MTGRASTDDRTLLLEVYFNIPVGCLTSTEMIFLHIPTATMTRRTQPRTLLRPILNPL